MASRVFLQPRILQVASFETGAYASGTTTMPEDNTIPQNTEGDEYMSLAFTPKSAASKLKIDICCMCGNSGGNGNITAALFRDAIANALAVAHQYVQVSGGRFVMPLTHIMGSPGIVSTTFKVRIGSATVGTTWLNGIGAAAAYGGAFASSIVVTEYMN